MPFLAIPLFPCMCILSLENEIPWKICAKVNECIEAFIKVNKEVDNLKSISKMTCNILFKFLWAAAKDLIPSIRVLPSEDDAKILQWYSNCHSQCIKSESLTEGESDLAKISEVIKSSKIAISESISASTVEATE